MPRNLDLTALRSFVTVAETGGVTRAAGFLHLTQSAVSMQLKRLEEMLGLSLLDRSARTISLTPEGEQLLGYAKRMIALNDEAWGRLTADEYEGEVVLGVPHDIVYPALPQVLSRFAAECPRVKVQLISSNTMELKAAFKAGECAIILTTEDAADAGGETLVENDLVWVGAPNTSIWRNRPLPIAQARICSFKPVALRSLDRANIPWNMVIDSDSDRSVEATLSADLGIGVMLQNSIPRHLAEVEHGGALPKLGSQQINLYADIDHAGPAARVLVGFLRQSYGAMRTNSIRAA